VIDRGDHEEYQRAEGRRREDGKRAPRLEVAQRDEAEDRDHGEDRDLVCEHGKRHDHRRGDPSRAASP
jgi:hypothetical protein